MAFRMLATSARPFSNVLLCHKIPLCFLGHRDYWTLWATLATMLLLIVRER